MKFWALCQLLHHYYTIYKSLEWQENSWRILWNTDCQLFFFVRLVQRIENVFGTMRHSWKIHIPLTTKMAKSEELMAVKYYLTGCSSLNIRDCLFCAYNITMVDTICFAEKTQLFLPCQEWFWCQFRHRMQKKATRSTVPEVVAQGELQSLHFRERTESVFLSADNVLYGDYNPRCEVPAATPAAHRDP